MRLGVLFSGGKDSTLALLKAKEKESVVCLISLFSENKESYMFHTPNIAITKLQAKAMNLPQVIKMTKGLEEKEVDDLEAAVSDAKKNFNIDGVVTGAIESVYQAERIQRVSHDLDLWCFNPLWKTNQKELLEEIMKNGFKVVISGVFAYPLDESWLGKQMDKELVARLVKLQLEYGLSPSGEGGEIETTVLDAPMFQSRIEILDSEVQAEGNTGVYVIKKAKLTKK